MPLTLILNGHARSFDDLSAPAPLDALLQAMSLKSDRVAVELNGLIVSRGAWAQTVVADGDKLEVVHFVGGGV